MSNIKLDITKAACFLEAGTCASYNWQTGTDGFDDRNAKTFVDGGVYKSLGIGIIGHEFGIADSMEHDNTMFETMFFRIGFHLIGIGRLTANDDERQIFG